MPGKSPGPSIKRPQEYEAIKSGLMKKGMSEDKAQEKAAKISNSHAKGGRKGR